LNSIGRSNPRKKAASTQVFSSPFLKCLVAGATRPIFLIIDRDPPHRAKKTAAFLEPLGGKLRLYFCLLARRIATPTTWGLVPHFEILFLYGPSYRFRWFNESNYCKQTEKILTVRVHTPRFGNPGLHANFWSGFFPLRTVWCFACEIMSQKRRASPYEICWRVGQLKIWPHHPAHV